MTTEPEPGGAPARADVLICGGGISALVAAAELAERGKRVTILERQGRSWVGGQARDAFGGLFFVGSPEQRRAGIRDSFDLAWADWAGYAEFGPGDENQTAWAKRYLERSIPDVREYLTGLGLSFVPVANWAERFDGVRGNRVPRFHLLWGCGPGLVAAVLAKVRAQGGRIEIRCGHRVDELLTSGGAVTGVRGVDAPMFVKLLLLSGLSG